MPERTCPCHSTNTYNQCCEPFIKGRTNPETAEALMRSRYSAFVKGEHAYIEQTHDPKTRENFDGDANKRWAESSEWLGLEIKEVQGGASSDSYGEVEFVAKYSTAGEEKTHHERSQFNKRSGKWYFTEGKNPQISTFVRDVKVGRNDPCPCGSGKKYKKCCALL